MPKLTFYYSSMNAGKTALLIQTAYNYQEQGLVPMVLIPKGSMKTPNMVSSRTNLSWPATEIDGTECLFTLVNSNPSVVLVDEAQFLTAAQVWALSAIAHDRRIPVICYGLRTDFLGNLFDGSATLLAIADDLKEVKTMCKCGKKATMTTRTVACSDQKLVGGNDSYTSKCMAHFIDTVGPLCIGTQIKG